MQTPTPSPTHSASLSPRCSPQAVDPPPPIDPTLAHLDGTDVKPARLPAPRWREVCAATPSSRILSLLIPVELLWQSRCLACSKGRQISSRGAVCPAVVVANSNPLPISKLTEPIRS
eukprot:5750457-Pleurochrysis_carterae.AAC.1